MRKFAVILCLFTSSFVYSADETFNWLKSTSGQNSALSGSCDYIENSRRMVCNIRQIMVSKELSEEDAKKDLIQAVDELETKLKSISLKEYVEEISGGFCKQLAEKKEGLGQVSKALLTQMTELCNSPSRENIIALFTSTIDKSKNTCKVYETDTGSFPFEPVNENKWVSNHGPSGVCGVVVIMTLERDPKHLMLWDYSQVRHYTNTVNSMCKSLSKINEPMSFSWNGKSPIQMGCEYINFGL